jgi:hypothetical protein
MNGITRLLSIIFLLPILLFFSCTKKEPTAKTIPNLEKRSLNDIQTFQRAKEKISDADLTTIRNGVIDFESRFNRFPNDLNELQKAGGLSGNVALKDPWGTSY